MKFCTLFVYADGRTSKNAPVEEIILMDEHPAKYVARQKRKLNEMLTTKRPAAADQPGRCDEVLAIYSAIDVGPKVLTKDDIERLS